MTVVANVFNPAVCRKAGARGALANRLQELQEEMARAELLRDDSRGMMTLDENGLGHPATGEARYANFFEVGYNAFEFLLEFGQSYANEKPRLHTRVVMSPSYAKELLRVLTESVQDYEKDFGTIKAE